MSDPRSLSYQRQCVEHLIALCTDKKGMTGPIIEGAKQAARTIGWIEKRAELIREVDRLEREAPELADLLREFPGAHVARVA